MKTLIDNGQDKYHIRVVTLEELGDDFTLIRKKLSDGRIEVLDITLETVYNYPKYDYRRYRAFIELTDPYKDKFYYYYTILEER